MRTEIHWVPESREVVLPSKIRPFQVWTFLGEEKPDKDVIPTHNHNAFLEDFIHDWVMMGSTLKYFSRVATHSVWILIQYKEPGDK